MRINQNLVLAFSTLLLGIAWLFSFLIPSNFLTSCLSIPYLFIIPGLLILNSIQVKNLTFWERIGLSIPLSILQLLFASFLYNQLSLGLGIRATLIDGSFRLVYFTYISIIAISSYSFSPKHVFLQIQLPRSLFAVLFYILAALIPILSISGTFLLNSNGSNVLTILALILILFIFFLAVLFEKNLAHDAFPYSLFMIAASLLLMYSLRSNYLVGWDINQEFKVFQITKEAGIWSMKNYQSAYNATLSISLLPTVIATLSRIPDLYIYKFLYPFLFCSAPIIIYLIAKTTIKPYQAFIASFFFMSQFQFMTQMPALNRQEIAFIFFSFLLYILTVSDLSNIKRRFLFLLCSLALVISHYSTAYVTVGLLSASYALLIAFRTLGYLLHRFSRLRLPAIKSHLEWWMVFLFTLCTFLWYGVYTQAAGDIQKLVRKAYSALDRVHSEDLKSDQAKTAIVGSTKIYSNDDVEKYSLQIRSQYTENKNWLLLFPSEIVSQYPVYPMYSQPLPAKNVFLLKLENQFVEATKKIIKVVMVIGTLYLCVAVFLNKKKQFVFEIVSFNVNGFIFLTALAILPVFSLFYNFERLYQQSLMTLGIAFVLGMIFLTRNIDWLMKAVMTLLIVIYFSNFSGLLPQLVGGAPSLALNNFGEEYDRFYAHDSELSAVRWLDTHSATDVTISLDQYSWLRFQSATKRDTGYLFDLTPGAIPQYGYVFESNTNIESGMTRTNYSGQFIGYNFPSAFLVENTNQIYSSQGSKIFK